MYFSYKELFKETFLVFNMKNRISAVNDVERLVSVRPLCRVSHFKNHLQYSPMTSQRTWHIQIRQRLFVFFLRF